MSTYYEYKDVKVMIAHRLMVMDGWKVYGYHADESDSMTDYYCPAYWNGIATKNGYVLIIDNSNKTEAKEIKKYNREAIVIDNKTMETIKKLEAMTQEHGASEQEEQTAKVKIELLKNKNVDNNKSIPSYEVVGIIPAHEANPPRCNWHIEKDGVIILKGSGLLKYSSLQYESNFKKQTESEIRKEIKSRNEGCSWFNEIELEKSVKYQLEKQAETEKLTNEFNNYINKIDTTCGGILGEGDLVTYERVTVTEYKAENKAVETTTGNIKEGQCFILKTGFNYGCFKGLVYRIHEAEYNGNKYYHAYKLNGKLTKECTGLASQNNKWNTFGDKFEKWIANGSIAYCDITEVKTPYEVEKVVKKVLKSETATERPKENKTTNTTEQQPTIELNGLHYDITEDIDTRDNSKIFVVKIVEKLDRDEYLTVNNNIKLIGGYYSKFKHGFIFKDDPTELLNGDIKQSKTNTQTEQPQNNTVEQTAAQEHPQTEIKKSIDFEIEQSQHTKTKENIWLVKVKSNLSKDDFAEVKRNFATLKGFYSSFNNSFIFKYDPTEKLQTSA